MRDGRVLDELCMRAAIVGWLTGENTFTAEIRAGTFFNARRLDDWLRYFDLADGFPRAQHEHLLAFLKEHAAPRLGAVNEPELAAFETVDALNDQAVLDGMVSSSLLAVLSTFACSIAPTVFAPLTAWSQRGLRAVVGKLDDLSYRTYMLAFMKERQRFAARTMAIDLRAPSLGPGRPKLSRDILVMRALDRRLMEAGGFPIARLEKEADEFVGWSHLARARIVPFRSRP